MLFPYVRARAYLVFWRDDLDRLRFVSKSPSNSFGKLASLPPVLSLMRRYNNKPDALTYPNTCAEQRHREREIEKLAITNERTDELARWRMEEGRIYGFKAADVFPIPTRRRPSCTFLPVANVTIEASTSVEVALILLYQIHISG